MIKFLLFAQLAEEAGRDSLELEYVAEQSALAYMSELAQHLPESVMSQLDEGAVMLSINQQIATWEEKLADGDVIGLLPPFSGG